MRFLQSVLFIAATTGIAQAGDTLQKDIDLVAKQGRGTPEGRAAWDRLANAKAGALPSILEGMNTKDTVASNWLRTAFDQVADRESKVGSKNIDATKILSFVKDPAKEGRARRFALDFVERLQPGTRDELVRAWEDDPEFRYDAVAWLLAFAPTSAKQLPFYQRAFEKSRDVMQARAAAAGIEKNSDAKVSVAEHLGFFTDWHLIGPFDGKSQKGLDNSYPPEKKVALAEELDGQKGKVRWKRYQVTEPAHTSSARHQALVDLREKRALGDADDAIAFAYTEFSVDKAMTAEMRGAADDNFAVFVNSAKVFTFEEWRNGVRHDRHRFPVQLKAGKNTVLVKVSQSAAPNTEANWEFFLRVVDATGKGIAFKK